jgi:hypothetical protein
MTIAELITAGKDIQAIEDVCNSPTFSEAVNVSQSDSWG